MNERYNDKNAAPQYDPEAARVRRALRAQKARRSKQKRLRRLAVLLVLAVCAALLLPGGGDIADRLPPEEERVIAAFTAAEKPILGICRGLQALNVFFGGTLYAYIPGHQSPEGDILHATRAVGELAELVGTEPLVNSNHHQAVHRLGAGLSVRQWAGDGVIEGICHTALPILAVQWHPEFSFRVLRRSSGGSRRWGQLPRSSRKSYSSTGISGMVPSELR